MGARCQWRAAQNALPGNYARHHRRLRQVQHANRGENGSDRRAVENHAESHRQTCPQRAQAIRPQPRRNPPHRLELEAQRQMEFPQVV